MSNFKLTDMLMDGIKSSRVHIKNEIERMEDALRIAKQNLRKTCKTNEHYVDPRHSSPGGTFGQIAGTLDAALQLHDTQLEIWARRIEEDKS